ncbi:MAG: chemotaxis protein CheB [Myxococcales bacterium]
MGGSAGAIEPLLAILRALPPRFPIPVAVVIHQARRRASGLAKALQPSCSVPVREAQDKQPLAGGGVWLAPPDYHLLIERGPACALSVDEPVRFSVPSIDVLFESAAASLGPRLAAVLLSGANADGAAGLAAVSAASGLALVQAPASATSPEMPQEGLSRCPGACSLAPEALARRVARLAPATTSATDAAPAAAATGARAP